MTALMLTFLTLGGGLPLAGIRAAVGRDDADEKHRPAERAYFAAIRADDVVLERAA